MTTETKTYTRFSVVQRVQHALLMISFTALAITGVPQKFAGDAWAETMIGWMGGIEMVRTLHHFSAILLLITAIAHFVGIGYDIFVERRRWTMFPRLQDVIDALNATLHNLGLRKEAPRYDHYSFAEKFEYWALVWGTIIMALTGFILWNPILSAQVLPGEVIPAAKAAHGGEALLAILAILTWHVYNVHLRTFNKSIFTGTMTRHEMEEEHPLELERLEKEEPEPPTDPEIIARRRRAFIPTAIVATLVLLFGVYLFTTAETTAVSTIPRETVQAFVPFTRTPTVPPTDTPTPTPVPTDTPVPTATNTLIPGVPTPTPAPATPTAAASPTPAVPPTAEVVEAPLIPANHAGRTTCQVCHDTGIANAPKNPPDHAGRLDASCSDCHKQE